MPDSLPPDDEGPDPYEGQDLDGLLSGDNRDVPEELLKVIPALKALRAAPRGPELVGEAAVRADFREIMLAGLPGSAFLDEAAGDARTLILPSAVSAVEPHVLRRRPHSHRRPPQRGRWRAKAVAGVAAAAVVAVGATALAATLSGSSAHPAASRLNSGVTAAASTASRSHAVDGNGTPEATAKPTSTAAPSGSSPSPAQLCREYFTYLMDPRHHGNSATESELYQQLSSLASGHGGVNYYCMRRLELWEVQQGSEDPSGPLSGNGQGPPGFQGSQDPRAGGGGAPGNGANDNGNGNGNGQGKNGPGPGGQNQP